MTTKKKAGKVLSISDEQKCRQAYNIPPTPQLNEDELVEWLIKIATDGKRKYVCDWIGVELMRRFGAVRRQLLRQQKSYDELWNSHYRELEKWEAQTLEVKRAAAEELDQHARSIADLKQRIETMEREVLDLQKSVELRDDADHRAIKMWQEANPGNDHVWPDSAKLTVWLMERIVELESCNSSVDTAAS